MNEEIQNKTNILYDFLFHFNHNNGLWAAIPRDKQKEYFNNMNDRVQPGILFSSDLVTLIKFLEA